MPRHYHVGYNMPGYLSNPDDLWTTASITEARDYIIDTLDRHGDSAFMQREGALRDDNGKFIPDPYVQARNDLKSTPLSTLVQHGWSEYADDLAYWINPCDEEGPDHEEDE